jgi:hypothetical protein
MDNTELQALLDREQIRNCIIRLARGEDRRDAALITSAYWPDAATDYGVFSGSLQQYLEWVVPGSSALPVTQHALGQTHIELRDTVALAETYVTSYHRIDMGTEHRDTVIGGRYLDRLEKRNGEWRIAHRTMLYDWYHEFGVAIDWSQGVMGQTFSAPHYTGRAHGDYSEQFFAKA